jgi:hypothetical protein
VTSLIPALSCRGCRPKAPFAELVRLSKTDIAEEMREEHRRGAWANRNGAALARAATLPSELIVLRDYSAKVRKAKHQIQGQ